MKAISIAEICKLASARPLGSASLNSAMISSICTDSRRILPQCLFVALRGDNFDGHQFLDAAAGGGAIAALVDRPPRPPGLPPTNMPLLLVPDSRLAMGRIARHIRLCLKGKVIAVAGSNGKTGTKNLIHSALGGTSSSPIRRGTISPKSFNNNIGVPLTIFSASPDHDYLVLELGTNHHGEIRNLTNIALPDIGVITNCSDEHLEGLGDIDGVRRENASLIEGMDPKSLLIINGDDPQLLNAVSTFPGRRITFGFSRANDLIASQIRCDGSGIRFKIDGSENTFSVPLLGRHIASNTLAAIAVARELGLSDLQIAANLSSATGPEMRLQLQEAGPIRILNDAYNANPASMRAAIETLALLPCNGRRIAFLGDMRELGSNAPEHHRRIGQFLTRNFPPDQLICVGTLAKNIADTAIVDGFDPSQVEHYPSAQAAEAVVANLRPGDLVLLKASRAIGLESIARAISSSLSPFKAAS